MWGRCKDKPDVSVQRSAALRARPRQAPVVKEEEKEGKLYVTVNLIRPRWQCVLGADRMCHRTFGLDSYGRMVYERCNGRRSVTQIVDEFAEQTHVSKPEAEMAVTQFMRTLMSKGLITMEMEKL